MIGGTPLRDSRRCEIVAAVAAALDAARRRGITDAGETCSFVIGYLRGDYPDVEELLERLRGGT